jgi:hypothetical protein
MKMKQKVWLLLFLILTGGFYSKAKASVIVSNEDQTITLTGTPICPGTPSVTGYYVVTITWDDFEGNTQTYQTPVSSPDLITVTDYGTPNQVVIINAASLSGFTSPIYFPDYNNDSYSLADVTSLSITIRSQSQSTTWITHYTNGVNDDCIVLPVYIENFTAQNGTALLNWTGTSYSSYSPLTKFEIERSHWDYGPDWTWQKIGTVTANPNEGTFSYSFTDNAKSTYYTYYRIKAYKGSTRVDKSPVRHADIYATQTQPAPIACSYYIQGSTSLCTNSSSVYSLNDYPDYSSIGWTATPFYNIYNSYKLTKSDENRNYAKLLVLNPNVITLTAQVAGCSTGGVVNTYVWKGIPPILTNTTYTYTTQPCTGEVTNTNATVTVTAFPGTVSSGYVWYVNGSYAGVGLSKLFHSIGQTITYSWEVRYVGPCGTSTASGIFQGTMNPPIEDYKISPNPAKSELVITSRLPACPGLPPVDPTLPKSALAVDQQAPSTIITAYEIFDYSGQRVKYQQFKIPVAKVQVNVSNIRRGNYRLKIYNGKSYEIRQIKLVN